MLVRYTYVIFKTKYKRFSKKVWKLKIFSFFAFMRTENKKPSDNVSSFARVKILLELSRNL